MIDYIFHLRGRSHDSFYTLGRWRRPLVSMEAEKIGHSETLVITTSPRNQPEATDSIAGGILT